MSLSFICICCLMSFEVLPVLSGYLINYTLDEIGRLKPN